MLRFGLFSASKPQCDHPTYMLVDVLFVTLLNKITDAALSLVCSLCFHLQKPNHLSDLLKLLTLIILY